MKKFFAKGLMALLPLVLTAVVLYFAVGFLYNNIGVPIGEGLKWAAEKWAGIAPPATLPDGRFDLTYEWTWFYRWGAPLVGGAGWAVGLGVVNSKQGVGISVWSHQACSLSLTAATLASSEVVMRSSGTGNAVGW